MEVDKNKIDHLLEILDILCLIVPNIFRVMKVAAEQIHELVIEAH